MLKKQSDIRHREEEGQKRELELINEEYVRKLEKEEREKLEKEKQAQREMEQREFAILQITNEFPWLDYDTAKLQLQEKNWNMDSVMTQLRQQYYEQKHEEEKREQSLMKLL